MHLIVVLLVSIMLCIYHQHSHQYSLGMNAHTYYQQPYSSKKFSFGFHLDVAREVIQQISKGAPKPEDLIVTDSKQESTESKEPKDVTKEGLLSDTRLWVEVIRNLSKDIHKCSSFSLTGSTLDAFGPDPQNAHRSHSGTIADRNNKRDVVAFSCGHAFTDKQYESKVLLEFKEQVESFPRPIPETLHQLLDCYKKLGHLPLGCPYCVFQYLRQLQLQECPEVPIKPWNQ